MASSLDTIIESRLPKPWEQPAGFQDGLYEWLGRAPWFGISLGLHLFFYFLLAAIPWSELDQEQSVAILSEPAPLEEKFEELPEELFVEDPEPLPDEEPKLSDEDIPEQLEALDATPSEFEFASDESLVDPSQSFVPGLGAGPANPGGRGVRKRGLTGPGGGSGTQDSLNAALEWLKHHQSPDGSWSAEGFSETCGSIGAGTCDGPGKPAHDVGVTGLALLAFLGNGDLQHRGRYRDVVARGLIFLRSQQDYESGLIGDQNARDFLYDHAIASLALCEAYYLSKSPLLKRNAQKAVDLIGRARNRYGAWRYGLPPEGDSDTSVSGWMLFALKAAKDAELRVDPEAFHDGLAWLDEVTTPRTGHVGYDGRGRASSRTPSNAAFPREKGEAMTAVGLLCRIFLGQDPASTTLEGEKVMQRGADLLLTKLPEWDQAGFGCDMYYWYYGTYAMFQMGGKHWMRWNAAMKDALQKNQIQSGDAKGSWNPVGPWGQSGGRVYSTAMLTLCLEVYFRYGNLLGGR